MKKSISIVCALFCFVFTVQATTSIDLNRYNIYINGDFFNGYEDKESAIFHAKKYKDAIVYDSKERIFIHFNESNFVVKIDKYNYLEERDFYYFYDAVEYAKENCGQVIHISTDEIVYNCGYRGKDSTKISVKQIFQMPDLPRGCEVVSLLMLLDHAGFYVDKVEIVDKLRKNPNTYKEDSEQIFFGHPNNGFVGDIYTFQNPGLGVYHWPIYEVAEKYLEKNIINMTGVNFDDLLYHIDMGYPIWVLVNAKYRHLPEDLWQTWKTEDGIIEITKWMHSVILTGYDKQYVYFNDPLGKHNKAKRNDFIDAWNQMGKQAISYIVKWQ